jgi:hypothetical protein
MCRYLPLYFYIVNKTKDQKTLPVTKMIAYLPSISKLTIFKWKRPNEFQFRVSLTSHLPDWMKNPEKEIFITNSTTTKMRQVYAKVAVVFLSGP